MTGIKEVSIFVLENKIYRGIANDIGGSTRTNRIQYVINPFVFILNLDLARMQAQVSPHANEMIRETKVVTALFFNATPKFFLMNKSEKCSNVIYLGNRDIFPTNSSIGRKARPSIHKIGNRVIIKSKIPIHNCMITFIRFFICPSHYCIMTFVFIASVHTFFYLFYTLFLYFCQHIRLFYFLSSSFS